MKIGIKPPALPQVGVDVVKTPAAPGPIPVPVPNVGGSGFTPAQGMERRFSVRFMNALPQQLKLAKVPTGLATKLEARFGTMSRSELDVLGRVAERLMQSHQPAQALGCFEAFSGLHTMILPGGHRVEPNVEGSWTVRAKGGEAQVLDDVAGAKLSLGGGLDVKVTSKGVVEANGQMLVRSVAEAAQQFPVEQVLMAGLAVGAVAVGVGVVGATAAVTVAAAGAAGPLVGAAVVGVVVTAAVVTLAVTLVMNSPVLMEGAAVLLEAAGLEHEAKLVRENAARLDEVLRSKPVSTALVVVLVMCSVVAQLNPENALKLKGLLDQAGRSAAPSPRNDVDLERGLLWLEAAKRGVGQELQHFAKQVRGQDRSALSQFLASALG